ncbi:hypothetical protein BGZ47_003755, partial [Haplosporangium gracile]
MSFFKRSNKNKLASAVSTPAQTPRRAQDPQMSNWPMNRPSTRLPTTSSPMPSL